MSARDPGTPPPGGGGDEGLRAALAEAINGALSGVTFAGGRWSPGYGCNLAVEAILAHPKLADLLARAGRAEAAEAELHAVDLAFEGLEETDRARRIGQWIATAAGAETDLLDLAQMYGEACGKLAEYRHGAVEWQREQAEYEAAVTAERDGLRADREGLKARLEAWEAARRMAREAADAAERSAREREAFKRQHPTCIGAALARPQDTGDRTDGR